MKSMDIRLSHSQWVKRFNSIKLVCPTGKIAIETIGASITSVTMLVKVSTICIIQNTGLTTNLMTIGEKLRRLLLATHTSSPMN